MESMPCHVRAVLAEDTAGEHAFSCAGCSRCKKGAQMLEVIALQAQLVIALHSILLVHLLEIDF